MLEAKEVGHSRGFVFGLIGAFLGAAFVYAFSVVEDHRKAEVEFVNQQIEKLYGPLFALSTATRRAKTEIFPKTVIFDDSNPPNAADVEAWRGWMKTIFQPMNEKMERAIVDNAQLIEGGKIPPAFDDLILHVESYKATMAKWKDTDVKENRHFADRSENTAKINFPQKFDECVQMMFEVLRQKRESLEQSWGSLHKTETGPTPQACL